MKSWQYFTLLSHIELILAILTSFPVNVLFLALAVVNIVIAVVRSD